jgi:hypothetical protein
MAKNNALVAKTSKGDILPSVSSSIQVIEHGRDIHMYRITDMELNALKSGQYSLNLSFFSLCIGAFIAFVIALCTATMSDKIFAVFVALTVLVMILAIYFGLKALGERRQLNSHIEQIRENRKVV